MADLNKGIHIMVDLETLGLDVNSVVLSAGFVIYDSDWVEIESVEAVFNIEEQVEAGRTIRQGTLDWWGNQNPDSYKLATDNPLPVNDALAKLLAVSDKYSKVFWWGNSAIFDLLKINSLIETFYQCDCGDLPLINEYHMRCYKSARDMVVSYADLKCDYSNVTHYVLDDCRVQGDYMRAVKQYLGRGI